MPITGLAIGAGVGVLKSELVDLPAAQRQRVLAAAMERYSPWTGQGQMQEGSKMANQASQVTPFTSAAQFATQGAAAGDQYNKDQLQQKLAAQGNLSGNMSFNQTTPNPWSLGAVPGGTANPNMFGVQTAYGPNTWGGS